MSLIDAGEYDAAYERLEKLGNTEAIAASKYDRAMEYIDAQDYEAAFTFLNGLNYKDSEEQSESVLQMIKQENIGLYCSLIYNTADVGDTVFFGAYEQDNDTYLKGGTTVCNWWLRSPGTDQKCATIIDIPGGFNIYASVNRDVFCVRPAMWIDIEN